VVISRGIGPPDLPESTMRHSSARTASFRPAALLAAVVVAVGIGLVPACTADQRATSKGSAGAPAATAPARSAKPTTAPSPSLLLALDAKNAETARVNDGYHVTLTGYGDVLVFTDRPIRKARRTTVELLADHWARLFGNDAPNAAFSGITPDGKSVDVAVELTQVSGDNHTVGFTVRGVGVDRDLRLPEHLADVSLFIDDVSMNNTTEIIFASNFVPFDSSF
jgi:hypothetical protein